MSESLVRQSAGSLQTFLSGWEQRKEVAAMLIKSKFLPVAYQTPEQVLAVMLTAHELNIPEMEALRSINVIQGKPTVSPQLMLALARRSGQLEDVRFERTADSIVCTITRKDQSPFTTRFGVSEAKALGLSDKDNYKKQPFTMFQWRALAANLRVTFSDVITGLYTPEELGAAVEATEDGEMVVSEIPVEKVREIEDEAARLQSEVSAEPETKTVSGATFDVFDPAKEQIGFGKNKGLEWAKAEIGWLEWCEKNGRLADSTKAKQTLEYLKNIDAQMQENRDQNKPDLPF